MYRVEVFPSPAAVMSRTGSESSVEGLPPREGASNGGAAHVSQVWLDGDVLACACPECAAPMSIRLWLRLAECRLCGTQVELTEEQEREAQALLERRGSPVRPPPLPKPKAPTWSQSVAAPPRLKAIPVEPSPPILRAVPVDVPPLLAVPVVEVPPPPRAIPVEDEAIPKSRFVRRRLVGRPLWESLVSCLVSLVVHLLIILLLGLWMFQKPRAATIILLAEFEVQPAGELETAPQMHIEVKPPAPPPVAAVRPEEPPKPQLPDVRAPDVKSLTDRLIVDPADSAARFVAAGAVKPGSMFAGRDPLVRKQAVVREGGNDQSERAVALGLKWLASHQFADGHWSLDRFNDAGECRGRCGAAGTDSNTSATALGVLPFLGAGYTHLQGDYRDVVDGALRWLMADQQRDGGFRSIGAGRMYAHGQAAIALCEAFAMTRDPRLHEPAQRAVDYIVRAQHTGGGWRYVPRQLGDLSVTGWEVMALRSAKSAQLQVPGETLLRVDRFLDTVQTSKDVAKFGYLHDHGESPTMTAEGMLCRQYGGWTADDARLTAGADYLLTRHLPTPGDANMYYWYYATQVMHHLGGDRWRRWNERMRDVLIGLQDESGHEAGSWSPGKHHDPVGGRLYMTALAVCTLEVYYRHMPLYRTLP